MECRILIFIAAAEQMEDRKRTTSSGDIVIIKDDNTPPMCWPLARIIQTFDGNDKIVRVVQVKTQTGVYIRPVSRLIPLHREESEDRGAD